jgi:hypothetical protein
MESFQLYIHSSYNFCLDVMFHIILVKQLKQYEGT